ncbi:MAG: glycoside hydrolase family 9 protein [Ruminococcus sp.]|nr:glycoside hydrolase family 9 protein [Ruminococcus sp.]
MKLTKRLTAGVLSALTLSMSTLSYSPVLAADEETEIVYSAPISEVVQDSGLDIDYARSLQYSLYFYDANMCGDSVSEHTRLSWRGDCHTYDAHVPMIEWDGVTTPSSKGGTNLTPEFMEKYKDVLDPDGDGTIDVAGGFHDAGDHVEFGMPENYTAATLGWGYYEYRDVYKKLEQDDHIETILRHFNDYLMKCTFRDKDGTVIAHCYQVGEGHIDHSIWNTPEVDTMARPAYFLTADKPQTDYVVSACASLAINYLNFKDTDPDYAEKSLDYAMALWRFANDNPKELSDNADGPSEFYRSNHWEDDYCWAAAWLYLATGDASVFDEGAYEYFDYYAPSGWAYCWNDMWSGAALMWAVINEQHPELDMVNQIRKAQGKNQYVFKDFWDDDCLGKCLKTWQGLETPQGFAFLQVWGSCRYNTAMQLICLLYDKYHNNGQPSEWSEWAKKQMDYVLGQNDITFKEEAKYSVLAGRNGTHGPRAFVVGYNDTAVKNPHHRAASGLLMAEDPREQRHILWGALAGGPDGNDQHDDATKDWTENEVTIDYNACLPAASAGLYAIYGTDDMAVTPNFPPEDEKRAYGLNTDGSSSNGYWVEALGLDNRNDDGTGAVEVSLKVLSGSSSPSKNITVRYFINTSEILDPSIVEANKLYDQSEMEIEGATASVTGPHKFKDMEDVYYVELSWEGCNIVNSGKKSQFSVGFYGKGWTDPETHAYNVYKWDPTNDWSYADLKFGVKSDFFAVDDPPETRTENICVYADGVLVGGTEPDGTKPEDSSDTTEPTTGGDKTDIVWGDADGNDVVAMNDVVLVMQSMSNQDKYGLTGTDPNHITEDGQNRANVYEHETSGITVQDALQIQKFLLTDVASLDPKDFAK